MLHNTLMLLSQTLALRSFTCRAFLLRIALVGTMESSVYQRKAHAVLHVILTC
jgi:hypothetical protein